MATAAIFNFFYLTIGVGLLDGNFDFVSRTFMQKKMSYTLYYNFYVNYSF